MAGSDLTGREMEVLELIVQGQSNKEIGASLRISEATVKSHINNILSKLGVTDRTQAATTALAARAGATCVRLCGWDRLRDRTIFHISFDISHLSLASLQSHLSLTPD